MLLMIKGHAFETTEDRVAQEGLAEVWDLEDASKVYCQVRDESGEGASTFPDGLVFGSNSLAYTISYNGKVWLRDEVVYNPYA